MTWRLTVDDLRLTIEQLAFGGWRSSTVRRPSSVVRRGSTGVLLLLILAYLVLAALYSAVVPLGEGPDEPGHAAYVFFLAREGRLPVQRADSSQSDVPGEGHQPPLAYLLMTPAVAWLPPEQRILTLVGNPQFTWAGGNEVNAVSHGSRDYWPWRGSVLAWHLARLVSVGLGALTVAFTYLIADEVRRWKQEAQQASTVYGPSSLPLLAAALVAFNPQFLFTSALVTNDALLVTLSALLLWLVLRGQGSGDRGQRIGSSQSRQQQEESKSSPIVSRRSPVSGRSSAVGRWPSMGGGLAWRAWAIGLVLGLALLTKQSAVLLIPLALLGVIRRQDDETWFSTIRRHLVTLSPCYLVISASALVAGWWYWRNWQLYGDPLGLAAFQAEFSTQAFDVGSLMAWWQALAQLHESFWGRFGWMNVAAPVWVLVVYSAIEVLAVVGLTRQFLQWRGGQFARASGLLPLLMLTALAFAWLVSFALTAGLVAWQGRLLFPALPAIAVLLALGLVAWQNQEPRTKNKLLPAHYVVVVVLFLLALWLPFGVIRPAYPNEALPEQQALARPGTPVYTRFDHKDQANMVLRRWRLAGTPRPGATLELTLLWNALGQPSRNWSLFIHLVDAEEQLVANYDLPPKSSMFPTNEWTPGDWVEGQYQLTLPPDLAPGAYTLRVGVFDQSSGRRTGVYDQNDELRGDALDLAWIRVAR